MRRKLIVRLLVAAAVALLIAPGCSSIERKMLFYPTHHTGDNVLTAWTHQGEIIGYARLVNSPGNVWLMLYGNAGQASDRAYALPSFSDRDSVYILEYPGYGSRKGKPGKATFNRAAKEAYSLLRETYPKVPVCVVAESVGSGPASTLAKLNPPPDKLVLIVPFDSLAQVAKEHVPSLLVSLMLRDNWDNSEALSGYQGRVEIFGAESDTIVPVSHAKALAEAVPSAKLVIIQGGHNEWAHGGRVSIRNP